MYRTRRITGLAIISSLALAPYAYDYIRPPNWDCIAQTIPYDVKEIGHYYIDSTIETKEGVDGKKQICKADKEGFKDRVTILKQPVQGVIRYIDPPEPYEEPTYSQPEPTAICVDGTYSYSQSDRGTCSWHYGVGTWLY